MKLQYWGTAASEGIPGAFCDCPTCRTARERGGRNLRTRSQSLVNDDLLIDLGTDTYMNSIRYGYDLAKLGHVLVTHSHSDHFVPVELFNRAKWFAHGMKYETLELYGSSGVFQAYYMDMGGNGQKLIDEERVRLNVLRAYETAEINGYSVTPFPATHGTLRPFIYAIARDGKAILYMHDTGVLRDDVFERLAGSGLRFDLVSYDCTLGIEDGVAKFGRDCSHMGMPQAVYTREKLAAAGLLNGGAKGVLNHFSHNHECALYDDLAPVAEKEGFIVAYDGLTIEF